MGASSPSFGLSPDFRAKLLNDQDECWKIYRDKLPEWLANGLSGYHAMIGPDLGKGREIRTFETRQGAEAHVQNYYRDSIFGCLIWEISRTELYRKPANANIPFESIEGKL